MKDKEWLKEEVKSLFDEAYESGKMEYHESEESIHRINSLVDQLDEPETLSQEWIDENKVARIDNLRKMTTSDVVPVEKLKNLLVPKQDKQEVEENFYTFDNAKKWLHGNGFVVFEKDKLDEEIQRMVDETYEATNEKPVIPEWLHKIFSCERDAIQRKYVDPWIVEEVAKTKSYVDNDLKPKPVLFKDEKQCEYVADNYEMIINAIFNGYEAEEEKFYKVELPTERLHHILTMHGDGKGHFFGKQHTNNFWYRTYLTEQEIKAIDERYWAFAEEVTE